MGYYMGMKATALQNGEQPLIGQFKFWGALIGGHTLQKVRGMSAIVEAPRYCCGTNVNHKINV